MTENERIALGIAAEAKSLGAVEISETAWRMANAILANGEQPPAPAEADVIQGGPEPQDGGTTSVQGGVTIGDQGQTIREQVVG